MATTREAGPGDLPLLLRLLREKSVFDGCPGSVTATEESLSRLLFAEGSRSGALVADSGGRPVGIAVYYESLSSYLARPCLWLEDLFVVPEARGLGAGTALLRHLARIARRRGCGRIEWTVAVDNGRGITFYRKHGAALQPGVHLCRVGEEAIVELAGEESPP